MNKNKILKGSLVLALILVFVLSAAVLVACNKPETTTYTVTVTCEDAATLANVKVQLKKADGTLAAENGLTEGKATFELEPAEYTATLTGFTATEWGFAEAKLTAENPSCTIALTKLYAYSVSISYPEMKDVFGATVTAAGPAQNVSISLYEGELEGDGAQDIADLTPAGTALTDATGTAHFYLPKSTTYTIVASNLKEGYTLNYRAGSSPADWVTVFTVSAENPDRTLPVKNPEDLGSERNPITLNMGNNTLAFTTDVNEAYYKFIPEKNSNYTFTIAGGGANGKVWSDQFDTYLAGEGSFVLACEEGKAEGFDIFGYTACTFNIAEGGEIAPPETEPEPENPEESATVLTTLTGTHNYTVADEDSKVYLKYVATKNEYFKISSTDENLYLNIYEDTIQSLQIAQVSKEQSMTQYFSVKQYHTYFFEVDVYNYGVATSFTIEIHHEATPSDLTTFTPSTGSGTEAAPYELDKLGYTISGSPQSEDTAICYTFTATQNVTLVVSSEDENLWLTIYSLHEMEDEYDTGRTQLNQLTGEDGLYCEITLTAGTTYLFILDAWDYDSVPVTFSIFAKA